jgi:repressor of nif and glnA expression
MRSNRNSRSSMDYIADKQLYRAVRSAQWHIRELGMKQLDAIQRAARKFGVSSVEIQHYVLQAAYRARRQS